MCQCPLMTISICHYCAMCGNVCEYEIWQGRSNDNIWTKWKRVFGSLASCHFPKRADVEKSQMLPIWLTLFYFVPQPIDGINLVFHNTCRTIASKFDESGQWQRSTSQISALCNDSSTITHTFTILLLLCGVNSHHRCTLMRACEDVWPITLPQRLKEG